MLITRCSPPTARESLFSKTHTSLPTVNTRARVINTSILCLNPSQGAFFSEMILCLPASPFLNSLTVLNILNSYHWVTVLWLLSEIQKHWSTFIFPYVKVPHFSAVTHSMFRFGRMLPLLYMLWGIKPEGKLEMLTVEIPKFECQ